MSELKFIVETSARHVHLTQEAVEILFGKGHELTPRKLIASTLSSNSK